MATKYDLKEIVLSWIRLTSNSGKYMSKEQKTFYRYSSCFKEKVVQEVSDGSSISAVRRKYDIRGANTVQLWLKKSGRKELLNTVIRVKMRSEDDKIKQLEAENKRLKIALADAVLEGFVYLSLLTDMYSRKIVGWSLSESLSIESSINALKKAIKENVVKKLIHHSDRGVQYCSHEYVKILKKKKIQISMTEENHCYENALAERVNGILKDEYLLDRTLKDFAHAEKACKEAINLYNTRRPHGSLKLQTPEKVHDAV
jgi:transposase InsO family protein